MLEPHLSDHLRYGLRRLPSPAGWHWLLVLQLRNIASIANSASYGYIALNGVDPIFASYGAGQTIDPGQPTGEGVLPAQANLPAICTTGFPCSENVIWGNGFSFPNLRNGTYRSWSLLRVVSTGTPSTNAVALVKASQKYVVTNTP